MRPPTLVATKLATAVSATRFVGILIPTAVPSDSLLGPTGVSLGREGFTYSTSLVVDSSDCWKS